MEETGGGEEGGDGGGVADGGVLDGEVTTGVDGCSNEAKPGFICMRRVIEGERPADVGTEPAAAADGTAAARLREGAGVATAPRDDIERGIGAIGRIGRSLPAAGIFCDVMPEPVGAAAGERVPADESLKLVLGAATGSEARGAMFAAVTGFFINLW